MISMEARGVLLNKFKEPFRTKPLWSVDWTDYEPVEYAGTSLSDLGAHTSKFGERGEKGAGDADAKKFKEAD